MENEKIYQDNCQLSPEDQEIKEQMEKQAELKHVNTPDVLIYTSDTCGYCHAAKEYLDSIGVKYQEKNVSKDVEARKELIQKRFMGVPVIMVGNETIQGFDKERLAELLEK